MYWQWWHILKNNPYIAYALCNSCLNICCWYGFDYIRTFLNCRYCIYLCHEIYTIYLSFITHTYHIYIYQELYRALCRWGKQLIRMNKPTTPSLSLALETVYGCIHRKLMHKMKGPPMAHFSVLTNNRLLYINMQRDVGILHTCIYIYIYIYMVTRFV